MKNQREWILIILLSLILALVSWWTFTPIDWGENTLVIHAGEWITTEDGAKVCRVRGDLYLNTVLMPDFCEDWKPPFRKPEMGDVLFGNARLWVRDNPNKPGIQIHTDRGWVP
jgi:hypothetical protein